MQPRCNINCCDSGRRHGRACPGHPRLVALTPEDMDARHEAGMTSVVAQDAGAPIAYGFSTAYIMAWVGVAMPSSRPSAATLPLSQGSSSRLPRSRSTAIEAFMAGG